MQLIGKMQERPSGAAPEKTALICRELHESVTRLVEFTDALPQGPIGKILKRELRAKVLTDA
jgi:hypothetical protein